MVYFVRWRIGQKYFQDRAKGRGEMVGNEREGLSYWRECVYFPGERAAIVRGAVTVVSELSLPAITLDGMVTRMVLHYRYLYTLHTTATRYTLHTTHYCYTLCTTATRYTLHTSATRYTLHTILPHNTATTTATTTATHYII